MHSVVREETSWVGVDYTSMRKTDTHKNLPFNGLWAKFPNFHKDKFSYKRLYKRKEKLMFSNKVLYSSGQAGLQSMHVYSQFSQTKHSSTIRGHFHN